MGSYCGPRLVATLDDVALIRDAIACRGDESARDLARRCDAVLEAAHEATQEKAATAAKRGRVTGQPNRPGSATNAPGPAPITGGSNAR